MLTILIDLKKYIMIKTMIMMMMMMMMVIRVRIIITMMTFMMMLMMMMMMTMMMMMVFSKNMLMINICGDAIREDNNSLIIWMVIAMVSTYSDLDILTGFVDSLTGRVEVPHRQLWDTLLSWRGVGVAQTESLHKTGDNHQLRL